MVAVALKALRVTKPWGRYDLAPLFEDQPSGTAPIGEIWFDDPAGLSSELMVKYLFTSARLSVQVHPDIAAAQSRGHSRGKDEAWIILSADADSQLALGLKRPMKASELRTAALDGSIEHLLNWQSAVAGDFFYLPAGTIHALGKGVRVLEIQQNADITYRFYDYGSLRELHLEEALEVAQLEPFEHMHTRRSLGKGRSVLCEGNAFLIEEWTMEGVQRLSPNMDKVWLIPIEGCTTVDGFKVPVGSVIIVDGTAELSMASASKLYCTYPGQSPNMSLMA